MKHKVSELEGALLDAAVAKADGIKVRWDADDDFCVRYVGGDDTGLKERRGPAFNPSKDWVTGGQIIEREGIILAPDGGKWLASAGGWIDMGGDGRPGECGWIAGPTPLVAAMRAYVTAALVEEISLDE